MKYSNILQGRPDLLEDHAFQMSFGRQVRAELAQRDAGKIPDHVLVATAAALLQTPAAFIDLHVCGN